VFGWVVRVVGASTHPLQRAMAIRVGVQSLIPLGATLTLYSVEGCRLANLSLGCSNFQGTILQCSNFQHANLEVGASETLQRHFCLWPQCTNSPQKETLRHYVMIAPKNVCANCVLG